MIFLGGRGQPRHHISLLDAYVPRPLLTEILNTPLLEIIFLNFWQMLKFLIFTKSLEQLKLNSVPDF